MIEIKSFEAGKGDAFLVSFGKDEETQKHIMIDMGFGTTYSSKEENKFIIKNEFAQLTRKVIDLLVITHIDADHINGALKFIKENGESHKIVRINEVWHNSYKHLQFSKEKESNISEIETSFLNSIINSNIPKDEEIGYTDISSYGNGSSFASYLYEYKYSWNKQFNNQAVLVKENIVSKQIGEDINIILLSPNQNKLNELSEDWLDELEDKKYNFTISDESIFDDAFEFFNMHNGEYKSSYSSISAKDEIDFNELSQIESLDGSVTNGSSIAFILEYAKKKLLFLGDAHEDIIYENLNKLREKGYSLDFEVVKLSHHGSNENISNRLLSIIESKIFLISTEGIFYNHPHIEAISKIVMKRTDYTKKIIFNYDLPIISILNDAVKNDKKNRYNHEAIYLQKVVIDD